LELDPNWNECPNCASSKDGSIDPPDLENLAFDGGRQKCSSCDYVFALDAGTCPACNAQPPIDLIGDDLDDYIDDDLDGLPA
jgi:hypothetical protein